MYAIVDIETTGGHAESNGITEIAVFVHDGQKVTDEFSTLINPGFPIPSYISAFTNITNDMVENAPAFSDVAERIFGMLEGNIFVAHNVNFDYSFVSHQLKEEGYELKSKKLCTVRLSRKLFPGLRSYSLGNICAARGITIFDRHRARGDAEATVTLFEQILQHDEDRAVINEFVKKGSKEYLLPPNLPKQQFDALSSRPGVYYFHDEQGKIIYVGKAKNIRKRVTSHFTGNSGRKQKQDFFRNIHSLSATECATELMAFILESIEIKKHWPEFNRAQKRVEFAYGIYDYEDQNGYIRLGVERVRKHIRPLQTFRSLAEALNYMQQLIDAYQLCPKLCMIDTSRERCRSHEAGQCKGACEKHEKAAKYNKRVNAAIGEMQQQESYAIVDKGLSAGEQSCILIENGKFYGMGYLPSDAFINSVDEIKTYISPQKENFFIHELVRTGSLVESHRCIRFN